MPPSAGAALASPRPTSRVYYGWFVLLVASAAMVGTLPGRTQGLGLITEPLLADLGIDRVAYATVNLWATLIGALGAIGVGQLVDRAGSRVVLTAVAALLGLVVVAMSQAGSLLAVAAGITLTRALGQSALSVVSLTTIAPWFVRRIDTAMAAYSIALSVGFMVAFPAVGALVQRAGWRAAWLAVGLALLVGLAPLAWLVVRRSPGAMGLAADGAVPAAGTPGPDEAGHTLAAALATPAFWVFALGTALYGLVASGIGLFNESILAERGFGPDVYYQTLAVTAITALAGNFAGGWLAARSSPTRLMGAALLVLAAGLLALPRVFSLAHVMAWAVLMGVGGGLVMVIFFSVWPRVFGRLHLGRIQGAAQAMTVVASAIGPLALARWAAWSGSYAGVFDLLAGTTALVAVVAMAVPLPGPTPVER